MNRQISGVIASRNRIIFWFVVLTFLGIWPALTNGQPFFYADTTAYVRGADLAVATALGSRFATDWARDQRRMIDPLASPSNPEGRSAAEESSGRVVLAGRSIIYGALLYLGEVFGGMWFPVIIQSLIATYLVFVLTVRALGLDFRYFPISSLFLFSASPLPFFISFLMPDVFAGFLILSLAILATSWNRLSRVERAITGAILLFAVLSHTTHLVLLIGLTAVTAGYVLIAARSQWMHIRWVALISAACVAAAVLWQLVFSVGVRRAFGSPPVRPPFVTAKLVSMLGQPAMANICASNVFVVCRFQDRFPIDAESFLWSEEERRGVFEVADARTKRLLSDEGLRFALTVIPPNARHLAAGVSLDALLQLTQFDLGEFSYPSRNFFESRMPRRDFAKLASTLAARSDAYVIFGRTVLHFTAVVGAIVTTLLLVGASRRATIHSANKTQERTAWRTAVYILLAGTVLNAIICGGIGAVNNRYQARVIWLIQLSLVSGISVFLRDRKDATVVKPEVTILPHSLISGCEPRSRP